MATTATPEYETLSPFEEPSLHSYKPKSSATADALRERLVELYTTGGSVAGVTPTPPPIPSAEPVLVPPHFTTGYASTFEGGAAYLGHNKLPDIDMKDLIRSLSVWDEEDQCQIPVLDKDYLWNHDVLYPLVMAHSLGLKVLTTGPTGSGKTTLHQNLAAVYGQPFYRLSGRGDMESDTILGRMEITGGSTHYVLGEFTKAFTAGYYILLDEIWKLPASINMALQRPLERNGILQIDDIAGDMSAKQFTPKRGMILALADNVIGTGDKMDEYTSTNIQDGSTLNRVDLVLHVPYLDQKDELSMLNKRYPNVTRDALRNVVRFANLVRAGHEKQQVTVSMSPRNIFTWLDLASACGELGKSLKWSMTGRYAEADELATVEGYFSTVFGKHPNDRTPLLMEETTGDAS